MTATILGELLRDPAASLLRCRRDESRKLVVVLIASIAVGTGLFGAVVGSFRGGPQTAFSALKLPLASIVSLMLSAPVLLGLTLVQGHGFSARYVFRLLLAAGARSSIVLSGLAPLVWLGRDVELDYHLLKLLCLACYSLAGLSALSFLLRALSSEQRRASVLLLFIGAFAVIGSQTAWLLRPYMGRPDDPEVHFIATQNEGGLLGAVLESSGLSR